MLASELSPLHCFVPTNFNCANRNAIDGLCLVERSGFDVGRDYAAIILSFVISIASRKVRIGVLPKHQRPGMRWIVGGKAAQGRAASPSQMGRFETQWLAAPENLSALADLSRRWIDFRRA